MKNVYALTRLWVLLSAVWMACAGSAIARGADEARPPNIVLILIDDMGYGDIGPFGSTKNRTPALDRMAREGTKFTSFYAAPVCSVSRAQVMTGCYGQRVSLPGVLSPGNASGINANEKTVAEILRTRGYATMCIGKWHLGDQPEFLPTRHGFDHYFGLPYSNDMQRKPINGQQPVVPLVRDEKVVELLEGDDQDLLTERYTNEATKFIRDNADKPFFLYLPHTAVHVPIHPGHNFQDKSKNGRFGDWVEEVDWSVGTVLEQLRSLKLDRRTLVMFTSDNGPWLKQGANGGTAGPLRGGKGSTWEGGMREPTIAWWPGRIAANATNDTVAGTIDLLPTLAAVAGATVPTDRKIDGRDISPLLFEGSTHATREAHFFYRQYKLEAVRQGRWKLALSPQPAGLGSPAEAEGEETSKAKRLYDLDTDIGERNDVAAQHADIVEKLSALAKAMADDLGDGKPGPGVRQAGRAAHPTLLYPAEEGKPKAAAKKAAKAAAASPGKQAKLESLKAGDVVPVAAAPTIANRPFTVSCDVSTTQPTGVIIAHGGATAGYAIHLKDGHVVFSVRISKAVENVTSPQPISGRTTIAARLAAGGQMTLLLNGQVVASGKAAGLISRQPQEDFCVGQDSDRPVAEYASPEKFEGTIENVKVTADE